MLRIPALLLLLLSLGCKNPPQHATTASAPATEPLATASTTTTSTTKALEPEPACDAFKVDVLRRAFAVHVGKTLPIRFEVDSSSGVHLIYNSAILPIETARLLATWRGPAWATRLTLDLSLVRTLSSVTAKALATWGAEGLQFSLALKLDGVEALSVETAKALSAFTGSNWSEAKDGPMNWDYYTPHSSVSLSLDGLTSLEAEAMRHLLFDWPKMPLASATHLSLGGLRVVPDDGLTQAQPSRADLHLKLDGISQLSPVAATLVGTWPLKELSLAGLGSLSAKSAALIGTWQAKRLGLGLEVLAPTSAALLAAFRGRELRLNKLRNLSAASAQALLAWKGAELALNAIEVLDAKTAAQILGWNARDLSAEKKITADFESQPKVDSDFAPVTEEPYEPPTLEALLAALYERRIILRSLDSKSQRKLQDWHGHRALVFAGAGSNSQDPDRWAGCDLERADTQALAKLAEATRGDKYGEGWQVLSAWQGVGPDELFPSIFEAEAATPTDAKGRTVLSANTVLDTTLITGLERNMVLSVVSEAKTLSPQGGRALARWGGSELYLNSLETLSKQAATALATWKGNTLELDGLTSLSPGVARRLARWRGDSLELDGVTDLSRASALQLSKWKGGQLELDGLRTVSTAVANVLARWPGQELQLDGLEVVGESALNALLAAKSTVSWNGQSIGSDRSRGGATVAEKLSPQLAAAMGVPPSTYTFHWLTDLRIRASALSVQQAETIVGLPGVESIEFASLATLNPFVAAVLATWQGRDLDLSGLESLSAEAASALAASGASEINLSGLLHIDVATAKALTTWEGQYLDLSGLENLSVELVRVIRGWKGVALWLRYNILVAPKDALRFDSDKGAIDFKNGYDLDVDSGDRRLEWLLSP